MTPTATILLNRLLSRGTFRHVQILLKLAELGSVQRTAEAVALTQSSVTQSLATIERLLETPLFQRHARGVRPTAACVELLPVVRQVMQGVTDGAEVVAARHRQGQGLVRLVASAAAINGLLVHHLAEFNRQVPSIEVHVREAEGDDQLLAITRGQADLAVCRRPAVIPEGWRFEPLADDEIVLACWVGHPLAQRRRVSDRELAKHLWIAAPVGTKAREWFDSFVANAQTPPRLHPTVTRNMTLLVELMQNHDALSFLPLSFVRERVVRRELALARRKEAMPMEPLGQLLPVSTATEGTMHLASFLSRTCESN